MTSKKETLSKFVAAIGALGIVVAATPAAEAATITFTDRATWTAASGGVTGSENFESFAVDTSFDGGLVALSAGMSIGTLVAANSGINFIDANPSASPEHDVNGTAEAAVFNGQLGQDTTPFITFGTPVTAFGADFKNLNDNAVRSRIELYSGALLVATLTPSIEASGTVRFFGFVSDSLITQIRFTREDNDVFGIDNIEISSQTAIPEPATLLLMGAGLAALRRKTRG